ncbi:hypothetical protein [Xanthomonas sp. WHRI 10204]|uniref:hypothetical protein n=1 Tax=Xanthomonas sp. WHRI 10204 TaxID=3161562 RepID=UPI0032E92B52
MRTRRTQRGAWNSLGSDFVAIAFQQGEIAATTVAVVPWFEDAGVADLQRMAIVQIEHQNGVRRGAAAALGRICRHKLMGVFQSVSLSIRRRIACPPSPAAAPSKTAAQAVPGKPRAMQHIRPRVPAPETALEDERRMVSTAGCRLHGQRC